MACFFPKLVDPLIQWFFWGNPVLGIAGGKQRVFVVLMGRNTLVLYPEAKNFHVVDHWTVL